MHGFGVTQGTAARSRRELQGEETCLPWETSAKGEDLQADQADLAGDQEFYIKSPLQHYSLPFRAWTRAWPCTFTDRCL